MLVGVLVLVAVSVGGSVGVAVLVGVEVGPDGVLVANEMFGPGRGVFVPGNVTWDKEISSLAAVGNATDSASVMSKNPKIRRMKTS